MCSFTSKRDYVTSSFIIYFIDSRTYNIICSTVYKILGGKLKSKEAHSNVVSNVIVTVIEGKGDWGKGIQV